MPDGSTENTSAMDRFFKIVPSHFYARKTFISRKLVCHIHLNPLRAGLVADMKGLDKYPWCGHSAVMNKTARPWQNIDYICELFSDKKGTACKKYRAFVEKGVNEGKRTDLTGGGLIRSAGGWAALKEFRKAGIRVKGDERILGDSDFVTKVLKAADEKLEERYNLKASGYDSDRIVHRVAQVLAMQPSEVTASDKSPRTVEARALLCFWAHRKLGMTTVEISEKLNVGQPAVSRLSIRGEKVAVEECIELIE